MLASFRKSLLDRLVLKPSRHPIDNPEQLKKVVTLAGERVEIFVQRNFFHEKAPELLVLKFPGTAGRGERSSSFPMSVMPDIRTEIWTWNPPGYGGSSGKAKLPTIAELAGHFWHLAKDEMPHDVTFWLLGNSLGCLSALNIASQVDIADKKRIGLILRNPPSLIPVVENVAARYRLKSLIQPIANSLCDSMNAMLTAPQCTSPAIFLQSECDTLVPAWIQDQIIQVYGGTHKKVILKGLGHDDKITNLHHESIDCALSWIRSHTGID